MSSLRQDPPLRQQMFFSMILSLGYEGVISIKLTPYSFSQCSKADRRHSPQRIPNGHSLGLNLFGKKPLPAVLSDSRDKWDGPVHSGGFATVSNVPP